MLCGRDGTPKALKSKGSFFEGVELKIGCGAGEVEMPEVALAPAGLVDVRRLAHGSCAWEVVLIDAGVVRAADGAASAKSPQSSSLPVSAWVDVGGAPGVAERRGPWVGKALTPVLNEFDAETEGAAG